MKSTTIAILIFLGILVIGGFLFTSTNIISGNSVSSGNNVNQVNSNQNGNVQQVVLSYKNHNYYPQTITVNVNQPVSISLDNSIGGCLRYFTIPQLNLQKSLPTPSDTLDFTPTQKGTYRFQCGMGMGYGTLIVQ